MSSDLVARIAVENTAYSFDKPFDYLVPQRLLNRCKVGTRVLVPFGRGNNERYGIVLSVTDGDTSSLKEISKIIIVFTLNCIMNIEIKLNMKRKI